MLRRNGGHGQERGQRGRFAAQPFCFAEYVLAEKGGRYTVTAAYLYDGLNMPCDVLEYLVEYCVQTGHNSIRYMETVGLDWAESGIRDVAAAKKRTKAFEKSRGETNRRRAAKTERFGVTRETDYNTVFSEKSNVILEQVVKKMEQ